MKKTILLKTIMIMVILIVSTVFTSCGNSIKETDVSYAGPMLDNVLSGIKDKDYDKFSKDFSSIMKNAITGDYFSRSHYVIIAQHWKYNTHDMHSCLTYGFP